VKPAVLRYMNRLSSLLFAMALKENEEAGVAEVSPTYG
jgi:cob(I)alamin adenosyltransferase